MLNVLEGTALHRPERTDMDTEKVLGSAAKRLAKAAGETYRDQREKQKARAAERARIAAERAAYERQMMAQARESYEAAMALVTEHNDRFHAWMPIKLASDPVP